MKRLLVSIFAFVLALGGLGAISVNGEIAPEVSVSTVTATFDSTVEVPVVIKNTNGFANLDLEINYDPTKLELINVEDNSEIKAAFLSSQRYTKMPYNLKWSNATNVKFYNGTLATLTFKVIATEKCRTEISVDYYKGKEGNYTDGINCNFDENFVSLGLTYANGYVDIDGISIPVELGDGEMSGTVYAALYDENSNILDAKIYDAVPNMNVTFPTNSIASYATVMWWNNMEPMMNKKVIEIK